MDRDTTGNIDDVEAATLSIVDRLAVIDRIRAMGPSVQQPDSVGLIREGREDRMRHLIGDEA